MALAKKTVSQTSSMEAAASVAASADMEVGIVALGSAAILLSKFITHVFEDGFCLITYFY